jgi:hypothetical protein|tara:strand:- start:433 stop:717 length:285 start_codon:yes stop_codon:yes gene_type:complete
MAVGSDGLIEFTLIDGKTVNINVNHIVSIEELTAKELRKENFKKYGSAIKRFTSISKVLLSSGGYIQIVSSTAPDIVSDTKATVAKGGITGGTF